MNTPSAKLCIYPGCERPAVAPHPLGGPQPAFCELEEHNALSAHQERERLLRTPVEDSPAESQAAPPPIPTRRSSSE